MLSIPARGNAPAGSALAAGGTANTGAAADAAAGVWSGSVDGFVFTIRRDDLGDLVLDFSVAG